MYELIRRCWPPVASGRADHAWVTKDDRVSKDQHSLYSSLAKYLRLEMLYVAKLRRRFDVMGIQLPSTNTKPSPDGVDLAELPDAPSDAVDMVCRVHALPWRPRRSCRMDFEALLCRLLLRQKRRLRSSSFSTARSRSLS